MTRSQRFHQVLLICCGAALSWLLMMVCHEWGHVLHAWCSGGEVVKVVLHPLAISRTDVAPNPHPLFVAWGGACWGCALPLLAWSIAIRAARAAAHLARFFAGFCLIANGVYLSAGAVYEIGDSRDILAAGHPVWAPVVVGVVLAAAGLCLWHGLGRRFGFGAGADPAHPATAWTVAIALAVVAAAELVFSPRA